MPWQVLLCACVVLVAAAGPGLRAQQTPPLTITTPPTLPKAIVRSPYSFRFTATGGIPPYTWKVVEGELPPGLLLNPTTGVVDGDPRVSGFFHFRVVLSDSSTPPAEVTRGFSIPVVAALVLDWRRPAAVSGESIEGALAIANQTPDLIDLTLIVVAVNEIGKAFVLGYQHFPFTPDSIQDEVKFGSSLPRGTYVVYVDAVGEVAEKYAIFRARLESQPLNVP